MKETLRRAVLPAAICLCLCCLRWAEMGPVLKIQPMDWNQAFEKKQAFGLVKGDVMALLQSKGGKAYRDHLVKGRHAKVSGPAWEAFFTKADRFFNSRGVPEWEDRRASKDVVSSGLWFKPGEAPFKGLERFAQTSGPVTFLTLEKEDQTRWILVRRMEITPGDFRFGSGLPYYGLPIKFVYPLFPWAWVPLLLGLLLYFLIPWPRFEKKEIHYPLWSMRVSDLTACLFLFTPFFAIPFIGGPLQAFGSWWGLCLVLWPIAFLSMIIFKYTAVNSQFSLQLADSTIRVRLASGRQEIPFSKVESIHPVEMRPPAWLSRLLWLGALFGSGADSARLAGQALITGSSVSKALKFKLKNNTELNLWFTNQMGAPLMKGIDKLYGRLTDKESALAPKLDTTIIKAMGFSPHNGFSDPGSFRVRINGRPLLTLMGVPLAVFLACLLAAILTVDDDAARASGRLMPDPQLGTPAQTDPADPVPVMPGFRLSRETGLDHNGDWSGAWGGRIIAFPDNSLALFRNHEADGRTWDILAVKLTQDRSVAWSRHFKGNGLVPQKDGPAMDYGNETISRAVRTRDNGCLLLYETALKNRTRSGAVLKKLAPDGSPVWTFSLDQENIHDSPMALFTGKNSGYTLFVHSKKGMFGSGKGNLGIQILNISPAGKLEGRKTLALEERYTGTVRVTRTTEGYVLAGTKDSQGPGHLDILTMGLDREGRKVWSASFGGENAEQGRQVIALSDGFLVLGNHGLESDKSLDPIVFRTNRDRQVQWRRQLSLPGNQNLAFALALPDRQILAVCHHRNENGWVRDSFLWIIAEDGRSDKTLAARKGERIWAALPLGEGRVALITSSDPVNGETNGSLVEVRIP